MMHMARKDKSLLRDLDISPVQTILTNRLQVADIIEHCLKWTGPADLCQTTFSVSEEFLRRMYYIRKSGLVKSARVILDYKGTQKTVKLWRFMEQTFDDVRLADNHSKLILAKGESGRVVSVITSQNLTRGNRYESAVITTDPEAFSSLSEEFDYISKFQALPLDELLR